MIDSRITHLHNLGEKLSDIEELDIVCENAFHKNRWFIPANVKYSIQHIKNQYLNGDKLSNWIKSYDLEGLYDSDLCIGHIMAGNIPLVGFHDFLCSYILGFKQEIKLSSKDNILLPFLIDKLGRLDPGVKDKVIIVDQLKSYDIVIATGSNNSNRYFEYYFRDKPKILRKNRNSVAIIDGSESEEEIQKLGEDIFRYFGLGCRNVSKLFLPDGYKIEDVISSLESFKWMSEHNSYMHNFDYNLSLLILNNQKYLSNDFSIWVEDNRLASPLSTIHYEHYDSNEFLDSKLDKDKDNIQCIISKSGGNGILPFSEAQKPALNDYADNIDVIDFLTRL